MKARLIPWAGGVVLLLAAMPAAGRQSQQAETSKPAAQESSKTITVTGCVTADADGKTFTITGTTPTDAASATPSTWTLQSEGDLALDKYAGSKVEITGTIDRKGGVSANQSADQAAPAASSGPRLHVRSIKPIADTCS